MLLTLSHKDWQKRKPKIYLSQILNEFICFCYAKKSVSRYIHLYLLYSSIYALWYYLESRVSFAEAVYLYIQHSRTDSPEYWIESRYPSSLQFRYKLSHLLLCSCRPLSVFIIWFIVKANAVMVQLNGNF